MPTKGQWVVYQRRDGRYVRVSRPFATRAMAEKERDRLQARSGSRRLAFGVGFVRD